jgi:uncharacterized protein (DUF1919 family)
MEETINIISHNCIGARIYQLKNMEYGNPFMWSVVSPDDFWYLYNHFDEIDFNNIRITKIKNDNVVVIDEKVKVYYIHYRYDKNAKTPTRRIKDGVDIYYDKIDDYIVEKYNNRVKRMLEQKVKPIFIVSDREFVANKELNMYKKDLIKYLNKENCIVVTADKSIKGNNVVYVARKSIDPKDIARIILHTGKI